MHILHCCILIVGLAGVHSSLQCAPTLLFFLKKNSGAGPCARLCYDPENKRRSLFMNKHWISHGPTSLQHVLMTLKKQTLVLLLISYTLKFGKASHQLKHGRDQQPCTFYSTQFQRKWHDYSTFPVPATVLYCISNHPMLGTLKAQMHRPHLPAEQKKGASTRFWTMVSCTNYTSFFFETNQAGELPIILKRRNNTQTRHHNNHQDTTTGQTTIQLLSNSTQTTTGWIGTSTRLHNSTRLHTPLLKSEWDINPRKDSYISHQGLEREHSYPYI